MEKVNFTDPDTNESAEFDAFILKETQNEDDHNTIYEMVEDDKELEALAKIFAELMEDVDIEF